MLIIRMSRLDTIVGNLWQKPIKHCNIKLITLNIKKYYKQQIP